VLRRASSEDLDGIDRLEEVCFGERRFTREHVAWVLRNPDMPTVVETEGGLRGAIMVAVDKTQARVLSVAVDPAHRRRGIATRLMAAAESLSRERGARAIVLEVGVSNVAAFEFYRKLGYKVAARLSHYYSWGEDAFGMTKSLVPSTSPSPPSR